jgi:hypothetical protein
MPVVVTASITARCWKQHTCTACGCVYRYVFERTASASGSLATDTRGKAARKIVKKITDGVDECPCPTCGVVQPDMVARGKITWHTTFTVISAILLLLIVLPTRSGTVPLDQAGTVACVVAWFAVLGHLLTAWGNPNARPDRNMREVQAQMAVGRLEVIVPGAQPNFDAVPVNMTLLHALCLFAVFVAPPAFLTVVQVSREHPIPRNPTLKPEVIGPGDTVTVPLKTTSRSIGGYWHGMAKVNVLNVEETGAPETLMATSKVDPWPKTLSVGDRSDPYESIEPWARVTLPDDPKLGGKKLKLQVTATLTYPVERAGRGPSFDLGTGTAHQEVEVHLAEAGVDRLYNETWNRGAMIGLGGCILGGVVLTVLAHHLKSRAKPNQVMPLWAPRDAALSSGFYGIDEILYGRGR